MANIFKNFKLSSIVILFWLVISMTLGTSMTLFMPAEGSTLTGFFWPTNGSTISGDFTFLADDQGDSTRCEFHIDGVLVGYMSAGGGGWEWQITIGTYAWTDGWHVIRFDAKGGTTGNDSKSIFVKFDNNAPTVVNVQTIYPPGQTASKPADTVTVVGTVTETTSGIASVVCDTSFISSTASQVMYDDGNHFDGLSGDGTYGTPLITITNEIIGYHPVYVNATDGAGNSDEYPGEVGIDTIDPNVEDVTVVYPKGQYSAKDGDQVRVTAFIDDEDPDVDIVLDIDRSGSMGWTEENKWSFHDIDISALADNSSSLKIRFMYESDNFYQFSGWNIDDLTLTSDLNPTGFYTATFENTAGNNNWALDFGSEWETAVSPQGLGGTVTYGYPDPSSAHGGSDVLGCDLTTNGNYQAFQGPFYATSPTINANGQTDIHLTYWRWLNADFPNRDAHTIDVSYNGGSNWTTIWQNKQQKLFDGKEAAKILIYKQGYNDRSALFSFGGFGATKDQDWTNNKTLIISAIDNLNANGGTPLWDSVVLAANYAGTSDTLKALVVLTDGANTAGTSTLSDAIRAIRNNEVPTFTIALGFNSTEAQLKSLANAYPGGSYYYAASSDQLEKIYEDISNAVEKLRFPKGALVTYVNATLLGGLSKVLMYDDGFHEDFLANDNIYGSELITIATNGVTDMIRFEVKVEDVAGRTDLQIGEVLVDNSIISIANSTVLYPVNKTNARDGEDIWITANIADPHGIFPPVLPNGISEVYVDAFSIGAASKVNMFDDGNHSDGNESDGLFGSEPITVTTGYAIGTFIVMLHAVDNASNSASQQLNVDIDNSGPTSVQFVWPIDNMTLEGTVKLQATAYDDAGIHRVEIDIGANDVWEKMGFNENTGNYEIYFDTSILSDGGPYKVIVRAFDNSGDLPAYDELSYGFFVDNTAPILTINAPRNGDYVTGDFQLNVSYTDPGLFKPTVLYKIDDTEWLELTKGAGDLWLAVWNTSNELDGEHTISFKANDTIGNSVQYSISVFIDNHVPICRIVAPIDNEYVQGRYTIKVLATDEIGVDSVTITFMDENQTGVYNPQSGYYEYTVDTILIEEGARTVDAAAYDLVGRSTTADQVIFHIDNSAPKLTINYPAPGTFVSGEIFIDVTTSDVYLAISEYKIDGTKWISTAIPWDTTKVLDGIHTIDIRSYDLLKHETAESIIVTVDNNDPTIQIHSPSYGQFVEDTFTFKVTAWDYIGVDRVEMTFFNQTVFATLNTQTNYYEYTFSSRLYDDAIYTVQATVFDLSGKSKSTGVVEFSIDNNEPELVLVSPESGEIIKGDLKIDVISSDTFEDSVDYRIDKGGYLDILTLWNTETLSDGEHAITVRAIDKAGHETTMEFVIVVDNNPPELSFVTPTANSYYAGFMNVRVSANDKVGIDNVHIRIDDDSVPTPIFRSPESGLYEATIDTTKLFDGQHSIYSDVYDTNGFVSSKKIDFYTDNTGPSITVVSPSELDEWDVEFTFNITDINGVETVHLNIDSSGWREITLAGISKIDPADQTNQGSEIFTYNYIWSTYAEDTGRHTYVVKAVDAFGNEKIVSSEVEVINIVIVKEEEPDYLAMINKALPLIIFITAIILMILLIFMFYRGTLHRWYSQGRRRAGVNKTKEIKTKRVKKKSAGGRDDDYDDDDDFDDYDDDDDDDNYGPPGPHKPPVSKARSKRASAHRRENPRKPKPKRRGKGKHREAGDGDGFDDISWD